MAARKLPSLRKPEPPPEPIKSEQTVQSPKRAAQAPRFSLKLLLLMMTLLALACVVYGGVRDVENRTFYVLFGIAVPVLTVLAAGVLQALIKRR